jgi:hypothetical protein
MVIGAPAEYVTGKAVGVVTVTADPTAGMVKAAEV